MGFFNPLFLLAGAAVLVPVLLHLFHRQESKTFDFPAIRYLLRTERDHARQIRTQQLLLLLLRAAVVLVVALLGARVHLPGQGGSHDPTALALVLDNSMSSTLVEDGRRTLDELKAVARASVEAAGPDDAIWVVRAGAPWLPAAPGGAGEALRAIAETGASHARGDLTRAVERARALVRQSDLAHREVHVFTDLQATAFSDPPPGGEDDVAVLVFAQPTAFRENRGVASVRVGGGMSPLAGRPTEVDVALAGGRAGDTVGVRLYVDGALRAAATSTPGAVVRLPLGVFPPGRIQGRVEIDPDPLAADDRRHFSVAVRDPEPVALVGPAPLFLREALAVLAESERVTLEALGRARTVIGVGGEGVEGRGLGGAAIVVPSADPALLPALNRRLAAAGIPFRYEAGSGSGARIARSEIGVPIEGVVVRRHFSILPAGAPAAGEPRGANEARGGEGAAALVELSTGEPWIQVGSDESGSYVLFASPLDQRSSGVPVSEAMIPLVEWAVERGAAARPVAGPILAGSSLPLPAQATAVATPDGVEHAADPGRPFLATAATGVYRILAGDSVIERIPVNAPAAETDLAPAAAAEASRALGGATVVTDDASEWPSRIFRSSRGVEPWRALAILLLVLLVAETAVAASRPLRSRRPGAVS